MKINKIAILTGATVFMAGCATKPYVPTVYDVSSSQVKSIALVDDAVESRLAANELSSSMGTGSAAGGLLGVLVVAAIEGSETSSRKNNLAEVMDPIGFDQEAVFQDMMQKKLAMAGYADTVIVGGEREKRRSLKDDELPETTADAILDVNITNFGVQKAKTGEEWRPAAGVVVRLLSSADKSLLMENQISYNLGLVGAKEGVILLQPEAQSIGYMKIKEIEGQVMADQMNAMLDEITDTIITLLK